MPSVFTCLRLWATVALAISFVNKESRNETSLAWRICWHPWTLTKPRKQMGCGMPSAAGDRGARGRRPHRRNPRMQGGPRGYLPVRRVPALEAERWRVFSWARQGIEMFSDGLEAHLRTPLQPGESSSSISDLPIGSVRVGEET